MARKTRAGKAKASGWKSKRWYKIFAPEMFGNTIAGETVANDQSLLVGRKLETTLGNLTNDYSKQNTKLIFEITDVTDDAANTRFMGHQMTRDYMRSLVKRRTTKIDAYTDVITRDKYKIRVKSSCFTLKRARTSQICAIRQIMNNVVTEKAKALEMGQYMQEIVLGKLSADIYKSAKRAYPLRRAEIWKTEVFYN